jgi:ABC-2 type transport system permease protein
MTRLISAELLKLRTTRTFLGCVLAAVALVPISVALAILAAGPHGGYTLHSSAGVRHVIAAASSGASVVLILGILAMAGEFRHGAATATFLITPQRGRVVAAKLAAVTIAGLGIAAACATVTLATALPWLAAKSVHVSLLSADVGVVLLGTIAATALYALIGVGVGALIRSQTPAVAAALVWTLVIEGPLVSLYPAVGRWLPGGASSALTSAPTPNGGLLPIWAAALVLTGYGLTFAAAGNRLTVRRDIT